MSRKVDEQQVSGPNNAFGKFARGRHSVLRDGVRLLQSVPRCQ